MIPYQEPSVQSDNPLKETGVQGLIDNPMAGEDNNDAAEYDVYSQVHPTYRNERSGDLPDGAIKEEDKQNMYNAEPRNPDPDTQCKVLEKRVSELIIANQELVLENQRKEKHNAQLILENRVLLYQNTEKEKRAAELLTAYKDLDVERAAYKDLDSRAKEKEKEAARLLHANAVRIKNKTKKIRALKLAAANKVLLLQNAQKEKRAKELEEAIKELESFSYSVSHDLRAPLRAINGFTKVLVEDFHDQLNEDATELLNEIIANSNRMGELIDNLLEFSRIGKQQVNRAEINVEVMVKSVIAELTALDKNRLAKITVHPLQKIRADRNMLKQVFINLVSNALKYSGRKPDPVIELGSYTENNCVVYYIKDNGAGFDMRYYGKLFGVFQRLHSSAEFEGTGVGLAMIHKIVAKHAGKVWAEGKVNEGACFFISLPVP
jgi:signal transduction histidine kinase